MRELLRLVGLTITGMCVLAGGRAEAQVSQNGPYYANPSWDQQLPASTRFVVLTNWGSQAVLDRETGLVWELTPSTNQSEAVSWVGALVNCREFPIAGRFGWRLPTEEELATLLDPTQSNALPAGHPFQGIAAGDEFWTASTSEDLSSAAYFVLFSTAAGFTFVDEKLATFHRVWCVRGGSGAQNPQ